MCMYSCNEIMLYTFILPLLLLMAAPNEKMKDILKRTISEAKAAISKVIVVGDPIIIALHNQISTL